jgi:hypothetical protein
MAKINEVRKSLQKEVFPDFDCGYQELLKSPD